MIKEVIWSPAAEQDLRYTLDYLQKEWNQRVINMFINRIEIVRLFDSRQDLKKLKF